MGHLLSFLQTKLPIYLFPELQGDESKSESGPVRSHEPVVAAVSLKTNLIHFVPIENSPLVIQPDELQGMACEIWTSEDGNQYEATRIVHRFSDVKDGKHGDVVDLYWIRPFPVKPEGLIWIVNLLVNEIPSRRMETLSLWKRKGKITKRVSIKTEINERVLDAVFRQLGNETQKRWEREIIHNSFITFPDSME